MKVWSFIVKHKYFFTVIVFIIILLFDNHIRINRSLKQQIKEKEAAVREERNKINSVERDINRLKNDPELQEEYIRNHYYMKKSDEDIFHIVNTNSQKDKSKNDKKNY